MHSTVLLGAQATSSSSQVVGYVEGHGKKSSRVQKICSHCTVTSGFLCTIHTVLWPLKTTALMSMNSLRHTIHNEPFIYKGLYLVLPHWILWIHWLVPTNGGCFTGMLCAPGWPILSMHLSLRYLPAYANGEHPEGDGDCWRELHSSNELCSNWNTASGVFFSISGCSCNSSLAAPSKWYRKKYPASFLDWELMARLAYSIQSSNR